MIDAAGAIYIIGGLGDGGTGDGDYYHDVWASTDGGAQEGLAPGLSGRGVLRGVLRWHSVGQGGMCVRVCVCKYPGLLVCACARVCVRACVRACMCHRPVSRALAAGVTWTSRTASAQWAARGFHTSVIDAAGAICVIGGSSGYYYNFTYYQHVWVSTDGGARADSCGNSWGTLGRIWSGG